MANKPSSKKTKGTSFKSSISEIPAPFAKAPPSLSRFLERLDPKKVHITHIDRTRIDHKKNVFLIPVMLNGVIALLLLWRLYVAVPTYWILFQTLLGYLTPATVDPISTTRKQQIYILLQRTAMFAFDFFLFRFVGPWPITFFAEQPANPCYWRWMLGFQKEEVVVRVSRGWGTEELMMGVKQGQENPFFKTRILPAIEPVFMQKTGYLMMDRSWDLEFELMVDSHFLAFEKAFSLEELDKMVFAFSDGNGWLAWKWEGEDVVEGRRKKVVAFKEKLTSLGKESLFWKWTEIVEEEREADGSFSPERQEKVAMRVQKEFEENGVDFDEVIKSIGGMGEVPVVPSTG
ncbi:uncharacterized protein RCC_02177 [Ramularia collo-cygni]|uniref:Uncharacterized protein n=1 Tax=Ramularia collo-cygni TaxID=112498 RepID=A0A2D3URU9_9PEZI|nr:uncharacterized protein RCC_02177 [Ramularia collo-cygni]CZT16335.1 uncharacterized protein RCC_02177 [Ramularia collo-cygni]